MKMKVIGLWLKNWRDKSMKYNIRLLFTWDDVDEMKSYTIIVPDQVTLSHVEDKLCENH